MFDEKMGKVASGKKRRKKTKRKQKEKDKRISIVLKILC